MNRWLRQSNAQIKSQETSRCFARIERALSDGRIFPRSMAEMYEIENSGGASCACVRPSLVRTSRIFVPTLAATALPTFAVSVEAIQKFPFYEIGYGGRLP